MIFFWGRGEGVELHAALANSVSSLVSGDIDTSARSIMHDETARNLDRVEGGKSDAAIRIGYDH